MLKYILKRLLQSVFTLFIIATVVFLLMRLMPESGYFGEEFDKMDPEQIEASLKAMGLRDPIPVQLMRFYTSILKGDFGKSIVFRPNGAGSTKHPSGPAADSDGTRRIHPAPAAVS